MRGGGDRCGGAAHRELPRCVDAGTDCSSTCCSTAGKLLWPPEVGRCPATGRGCRAGPSRSATAATVSVERRPEDGRPSALVKNAEQVSSPASCRGERRAGRQHRAAGAGEGLAEGGGAGHVPEHRQPGRWVSLPEPPSPAPGHWIDPGARPTSDDCVQRPPREPVRASLPRPPAALPGERGHLRVGQAEHPAAATGAAGTICRCRSRHRGRRGLGSRRLTADEGIGIAGGRRRSAGFRAERHRRPPGPGAPREAWSAESAPVPAGIVVMYHDKWCFAHSSNGHCPATAGGMRVPTGVAIRDARRQLFDAAERVLLRDGPSALTSRRSPRKRCC